MDFRKIPGKPLAYKIDVAFHIGQHLFPPGKTLLTVGCTGGLEGEDCRILQFAGSKVVEELIPQLGVLDYAVGADYARNVEGLGRGHEAYAAKGGIFAD